MLVYITAITLHYCLFFHSRLFLQRFGLNSHTHLLWLNETCSRASVSFSHTFIPIERNSITSIRSIRSLAPMNDEQKKIAIICSISQVIEHRWLPSYIQTFSQVACESHFSVRVDMQLIFLFGLRLFCSLRSRSVYKLTLCGYNWVYLTISALSIASARAHTHISSTLSQVNFSFIFSISFAFASKFIGCIESNSIWIDNRRHTQKKTTR